MTRVYVVMEEGSTRILGYHAINLGMMNADELERRPRGAPDHGEIPMLFLGQVAVPEDGIPLLDAKRVDGALGDPEFASPRHGAPGSHNRRRAARSVIKPHTPGIKSGRIQAHARWEHKRRERRMRQKI